MLDDGTDDEVLEVNVLMGKEVGPGKCSESESDEYDSDSGSDEEEDEKTRDVSDAFGEDVATNVELKGKFIKSVAVINTCTHCKHYHNSSFCNVQMQHRAFIVNLHDICVSYILHM